MEQREISKREKEERVRKWVIFRLLYAYGPEKSAGRPAFESWLVPWRPSRIGQMSLIYQLDALMYDSCADLVPILPLLSPLGLFT